MPRSCRDTCYDWQHIDNVGIPLCSEHCGCMGGVCRWIELKDWAWFIAMLGFFDGAGEQRHHVFEACALIRWRA